MGSRAADTPADSAKTDTSTPSTLRATAKTSATDTTPTRTKTPAKGKTPVKAKAPVKTKTSAKPTTRGKSQAPASSKATKPVATPATSSAKSPTSSTKSKSRPARTSTNIDASRIRAELNELETRLKRADAVTRSGIESLETVVSALEANSKKARRNQKQQLTRHVEELTRKLEDQAAQTRAMVRNELKAALAAGGLDRLGDAIETASTKLDSAEIAQAEALARINGHLANMARAVDQRFNDEREARDAAIRSSSTDLTDKIESARKAVEARVTRVERDSADALTKVGEAIELVHGRLSDRQQSQTDVVTEKVNELALQTQVELESHQARIESRLEAIESTQIAQDENAERAVSEVSSHFKETLKAIQDRLAELERRPAADLAQPLPRASLSSVPGTSDNPYATQPPNPVHVLHDRLSHAHTPAHPDGGTHATLSGASQTRAYAEPQHLPSFAVPAHDERLTAGRPAHMPVEFDPRDLLLPPEPVAPPLTAPMPTPPNHGMGAPNPGANAEADPPLPPFQPPMPSAPLGASAPAEPDDFQPAPLPDAVYANPAYAEAADDGSPIAVRVADDGDRKPRKIPLTQRLASSGASGTGRNLKLLLMASGIALAAVLAGRMILSGPAPSDPNAVQGSLPEAVDRPTPTNAQPMDSGAISFTTPSEAVTEPIGDYAENAPIQIDLAELDTLEAAVAAGNSIAQFQAGLAKLDAGDTAAGATLIRQSASANQPAALYRLAKLYEAGEGVPQDDAMARQLIERAARGGNRIAMHDLALYYTEGRGGVELDMQTARSWFEQAARRGVVDSQFNLAVLAESTEVNGTPDIQDALFWYSVAANQGDQFAVSRRDVLRGSLTTEQLADLDARVDAFTPRPIDEAANGIFNDVPWISQTEDASNAQVRQVQRLLSSLGYSVGPADGLMGAKTRTAIIDFQRSNGLQETGAVSTKLVQRLANAGGV